MEVTIPCPCPPRGDGAVRHPFIYATKKDDAGKDVQVRTGGGDTVTLREPLDFRTRLVLRQTVKWVKTADEDATEGEILGALTEAYVLHCIDAWSLVDEKGKALPPSRANIRAVLMADDRLAMPVADAADRLYSEVVLLPLLIGASSSSPGTPTDESTSPMSNGRTPRPKPSRRSSTSTSTMAGTGPTQLSPGGASNS